MEAVRKESLTRLLVKKEQKKYNKSYTDAIIDDTCAKERFRKKVEGIGYFRKYSRHYKDSKQTTRKRNPERKNNVQSTQQARNG